LGVLYAAKHFVSPIVEPLYSYDGEYSTRSYWVRRYLRGRSDKCGAHGKILHQQIVEVVGHFVGVSTSAAVPIGGDPLRHNAERLIEDGSASYPQ